VPRVGSAGNLGQLAKDSAGEGAAAAANSAGVAGGQQRAASGGGSTFDDILKGIEQDKGRGKEKKKSFF
jgi:hypothetical protein